MAYKSTLSSVNIQKALDTIHEAITIGGGILSLTPKSTKDEIFSAFGDQNTFTEIAGKSLNGDISLGIDLNDGNSMIGNVVSSVWADGSQIAESTIKLYVLYLYKGEIVYDEFIYTYIDNVADVKLNQKRTEVGYGSANGTGFNDIKWTDYFSTDSGNYYPANGDILYLSQETYDSLNDVSETAKITRVLAPCGVFFSTAITTSVSGNINQITFAPIPTWKSTGTKTTDNIFVITITSHTPDSTHPEPYQATVEIGNMVTKTRVENVLTGNIASHTHDDGYSIISYEIDTGDDNYPGDGDLSGSGTKEDPYLIQSVDDYYLFLRQNNPERDFFQKAISSESTTYFKITKNLVFSSTPIARSFVQEINDNYKYIDLDGSGCYIKGLNLGYDTGESYPGEGNYSLCWILPMMTNSFVHDINFIESKLSISRYNAAYQNIGMTSIYTFYNKCVFDLSFDNNYHSINRTEVYFPSQMYYENKLINAMEESMLTGAFMGFKISFNGSYRKVIVGLNSATRGYFDCSEGWNPRKNIEDENVDDIAIIKTEDDINIDNFEFCGLNYIGKSAGSGPAIEYTEVQSILAENLNTIGSVNNINNGNELGFEVSDIEGVNIPIIPGRELTYKGYAKRENVLEKTNIQEYTPTEDYHPATKKYVDDQIASVESGGSSGGLTADDVLTKTNTTSYTPTSSYHPATKKYVDDNSVSPSEVLTKTNTTSYTPTSNYHPATKKYVDDQIANVESSGGGVYVDDTVSSAKSSLNSSITSISNRVSNLESAESSSMAVNVTSYLQEFLPDTAGELSYTSSSRISSSDLSSLRSVISSGKMAYVKLSAGSGLSYGAVCPIALTYVSSSCIHFYLPYNAITSNIVGYIGVVYTNQSGSITEIQGNIA